MHRQILSGANDEDAIKFKDSVQGECTMMAVIVRSPADMIIATKD